MSDKYTPKQRLILLCGAVTAALAYNRDKGMPMTPEDKQVALELAKLATVGVLQDPVLLESKTTEALVKLGRELLAEAREAGLSLD